MSLIAEALRKSEAERRRGQVPSLVSLEDWTPRRRPVRRSHTGAWLAAVALVAAIGGWAGYAYVIRPAQEPPTAAAGSGKPTGEVHGTDNPTAPSSTKPVAAPIPTLPTRASERVVSVDATPGPTAAPVEPTRPPAASAMVAPPPASPSPPVAAPAVPHSIPLPPVAEAAASESAPPASAAPTLPHVPSVVELSDAERATLPALKLNMHVYAKEPASRFVLVNGNRLGEGEAGSDGVRVVEIRPDGVVIEAKSLRVYLPRG
jgi:general secretion pathway protein B